MELTSDIVQLAAAATETQRPGDLQMSRKQKGKPKTYEEKLLWYATAPRASTKVLHSIVDKEIVEGYGGTLRGHIVSLQGEPYRKPTRSAALDLARRFRQSCIDEAIQKGLMQP